MFNIPEGQRKVFMHLATCVASGVICYGYMILSDSVEASVIITALTAIGGHGMLNANANGKEHESKNNKK